MLALLAAVSVATFSQISPNRAKHSRLRDHYAHHGHDFLVLWTRTGPPGRRAVAD